MRLPKSEGMLLYIRNLGKQWQKLEDLSLRPVDLMTESGSILVFVRKAQEKKFLQMLAGKQQLKDAPRLDPKSLEIGDALDVRHSNLTG